MTVWYRRPSVRSTRSPQRSMSEWGRSSRRRGNERRKRSNACAWRRPSSAATRGHAIPPAWQETTPRGLTVDLPRLQDPRENRRVVPVARAGVIRLSEPRPRRLDDAQIDSLAPATTPFGPSVTSCSACGFATIVIATSARRAATAGLSARVAPSATSSAALAAVLFQTISSWPASRRRRAMRLPIAPSPTKATALTVPS